MRMDDSTGMTAADVLNEYSEADLARVLRNWGEERVVRSPVDIVNGLGQQGQRNGTARVHLRVKQ